MNTWILWSVIVVYFALLILIGRMGYKMSNNLSDFVAGNWNMGLLLVGGTFVATWVSSVSIMGFPGMLFGKGLVALTAIYSGFFMANSLMPIIGYKIRRPVMPPATIPEYFRLRFEPHSKKSGLQAIGGIAMAIGYLLYVMIQISAFGYIFSSITGLSYLASIFIFGIFVLYIAAGGTLSVATSDLFNSLVIIVSVVVGALIILPKVGGWSQMWAQYASINSPALEGKEVVSGSKMLTLLGPYSISTVIGMFISSSLGASVAPHWPSRMLYARNVKTAVALPMVSQIIIAFFVFGSLLIMGVGGRVLIGTLSAKSTDALMPLLFLNHFPSILGALGIAGLVAASVSTTNSMLFHGALAVIYDVFKNYAGKSYNDKALERAAKITVLAVGLIAIVIAIKPPEFIAVLSAYVFGFWGSAFIVPVYMGLYWKRLNRKGAYWAMITGPISYVTLDLMIKKNIISGFIPAIVWSLIITVSGAIILSLVYEPAPRECWEPFWEPEVSNDTEVAWAAARKELLAD